MSEQETGSARERHGAAARAFAARQGWLYPEPAEPLSTEPEQQESLLLCFRCVTGTCLHREQLTPVRSGTVPLHAVPAITARQGTLLCLGCAPPPRSR